MVSAGKAKTSIHHHEKTKTRKGKNKYKRRKYKKWISKERAPRKWENWSKKEKNEKTKFLYTIKVKIDETGTMSTQD